MKEFCEPIELTEFELDAAAGGINFPIVKLINVKELVAVFENELVAHAFDTIVDRFGVPVPLPT